MAVRSIERSFQNITVTDATVKTYPHEVSNPEWLGATMIVSVDGVVIAEGQYTLTENSITLDDAVTLNVNSIINLRRVTPITQLETFENVSYLEEVEVERAIDKLTYIAQEIRDRDG